MNSKLLQFIASRMAELAAEEASLNSRLQEIEAERHTLKQAEIVSTRHNQVITKYRMSDRAIPSRIKPDTIMAYVMDILEKHPEGLIALDILGELNKTHEPPYLRSSLSPQLSRLKQGGFIGLDGSAWKLIVHDWKVRNDLFPDGDLDNVSEPSEGDLKNKKAADEDPAKDTSTASSSTPEQSGKARLGGGP